MRGVIESAQAEGGDIVTIDGVKLYRDRDWALVVPHPEEPLVRVWAEAGTHEEAEAMAAELSAMIEEMKT
jgi:phosphomannomutase